MTENHAKHANCQNMKYFWQRWNLRGIKEDKSKKASRSEEVRFFEYKG